MKSGSTPWLVGGAAYWSAKIIVAEDLASEAEQFWSYVRRMTSSADRLLGMERAIEADLRLFASRKGNPALPLWLDGNPTWIASLWSRMSVALDRRRENWRGWIEWYDQLLLGSSLSPPEELMRALQDLPLWLLVPAEANIAIWGKPDAPLPLEEANPSSLAGPYAVLWRLGKLEAEPTLGEPTNADLARDMLEGVRALAEQTRDILAGNLADPPLLATIEGLIAELGGPVDALRIGRIQIYLRTIEAFANAYADPAREADVLVRGLLAGLGNSLFDFTSQYAAVREMEAGRIALGVVTQADVRPLLAPISDIVQLSESSSLVGESVTDALQEGNVEIAVLTSKIDDSATSLQVKSKAISDRGAIIGQQLLTVWNFGAAVVGEVTAGTKTGIRKGVERGVETAVSGAITGAVASLAVYLGNPLVAISLLVESFKPLARRAKEVEKEEEPVDEPTKS